MALEIARQVYKNLSFYFSFFLFFGSPQLWLQSLQSTFKSHDCETLSSCLFTLTCVVSVLMLCSSDAYKMHRFVLFVLCTKKKSNYTNKKTKARWGQFSDTWSSAHPAADGGACHIYRQETTENGAGTRALMCIFFSFFSFFFFFFFPFSSFSFPYFFCRRPPSGERSKCMSRDIWRHGSPTVQRSFDRAVRVGAPYKRRLWIFGAFGTQHYPTGFCYS